MRINNLKADSLEYVNVFCEPLGCNLCVIFHGPDIVRIDLNTGRRIQGFSEMQVHFPNVEHFYSGSIAQERVATRISNSIGKRRSLASIKAKLHGTDFQIEFWRWIQAIPFGQTRTYAEIANSMSLSSKYSRAVAQAVAANPMAILVPCHRVHSKAEGFRWVYNVKLKLLSLEGHQVPSVRFEQEV